MAGEPNLHRPLRPPPPLLFQFPTLSPVPSWLHQPQPALPPPIPMHQQQQQQQQQVQQQQPKQPQQQARQVPGFQFGNLNSFQRAASAPDLNRLPVPFSAPSPPLSLGFGCPATTSAGLPPQTSIFREPMLVFPHAQTPGQLLLPQQQQQQVAQVHAGFELARVSPGSMVQAPPASSSVPQQKVARSVYPPALATQEDVVSDSDAFFKTLNKFFEYMGWELIIPRVGGKVFEIHRLYCEVTEQGGLEKVTRQKKWKDIATAFVLPKTVTSPTYFLRKHYINILHHYEQVYYHRKQGPVVRAPDALPGPLQQAPQQQQKPVETDLRKKKRMKFDQGQGSKADPLASLGHTVTGAIDGKFDYGYFVTVVVGSEKLRGVIYSVPEDQPPEDEGEEDVEEEETLLDPARTTKPRELRSRKRKRGRLEGSKKDPNAVKQPRNAYNFFVANTRLNMRGTRTELSKTVGIKWKELSPEDKLRYVAMAKEDKERYEREMAEREEARVKPSGDGNEVEQDEHGEAVNEMTSSRQATHGAPGSNLPPRQDVQIHRA